MATVSEEQSTPNPTKLNSVTPRIDATHNPESVKQHQPRSGDRVGTKLFTNEPKIWVNQPPNFTLTYDTSMKGKDEVILSEEEIEEGIVQWKHTLVATVVGIEVTSEAMKKYIAVKWKQISPPTVSKKSGVFLLCFNSEDDLNAIMVLPLNFVFDRPLLMKRYEVGMKLGKSLFT